MQLVIFFLLEFDCITFFRAFFTENKFVFGWIVVNCYYIAFVVIECIHCIILCSVY